MVETLCNSCLCYKSVSRTTRISKKSDNPGVKVNRLMQIVDQSTHMDTGIKYLYR